MRKDRLYFYTFLAIAVIFIIIGGVATHYFVRVSADQVLDTQLEASKREAREVAVLVGSQLANGIRKDIVISNAQLSIQNTNVEAGFVSMFDWSGKKVCHPDRTQVGQKMTHDQSSFATIDGDLSTEDFYEMINRQDVDVSDFGTQDQHTEIVYLYPVPNSDWIVAAHANTNKIKGQIQNLRNRFYVIISIMGFVMILLSVITVRSIGSLYEKNLELKNRELESEVINLAKLNSDLGNYQKKVIEERTKAPEAPTTNDPKENAKKENGKKRILTYLRNELLTIATDDIAYIYTENTITYVVDLNGRKSTTNSSLEELYSGLDSSYFYRANRQFIIAISAIDKIIRYGNNQLKILVRPNSEIDIIIGKNKAAEFKQWLNL